MSGQDDAKYRTGKLREEIARHDHLYYVENDPEISDAEYDGLLAELEDLEQAHPDLVTPESPTQRVGAPPESGLERVTHLASILSLEAVRHEREVEAFLSRVRDESNADDITLFAEPKFDGLSIEVVYEKGRFVRASTRGDGETGEDISHTIRTARALPLRLNASGGVPDELAVRGEALLPKESFQEANKVRLERGDEPFANARNAAAGILRRLDPSEAENTSFAVTFYEATGVSCEAAPTQQALLEIFEEWGLPVLGPCRRCSHIKDIRDFHRELDDQREDLAFEIDGVVLKLDARGARDDMGIRARSPRWAVAWKFAPRREVTRIADIAVGVGRTGVLTPVALLDPVDVGGVTLARATLHNIEEVRRKDLRVGDKVRVERAGDVIPEIVERIKQPGRERGSPFKMPDTCPACGAGVERRGPDTLCPAGIACPAQLAGRIVHYASRAAMDIEGLGEKTVTQLVEKGMVSDLADIYDLEPEDFERLEGFAEGSASKLHEAIHAADEVPLNRFLVALGIDHVGSDVARRLAGAFGTLEVLREAGESELAGIDRLGQKTAKSVHAFFREPENAAVVDRLLKAGCTPQQASQQGDRSLEGTTFVLTGALQHWTRAEATDEIERRGGRVTSSVSGNTDFVVIGDEPGSKRNEARAEDAQRIDEAELRKMLE